MGELRLRSDTRTKVPVEQLEAAEDLINKQRLSVIFSELQDARLKASNGLKGILTVDAAERRGGITQEGINAFAVLTCSLEKEKGEKKMQIKWKCLIFTGAENNPAAHGKAQLVLRLIATTKPEWLTGLAAGQAQTKQHQAVSPLPHSHPAPVLLSPANYTGNSHPTINSASSGRLH